LGTSIKDCLCVLVHGFCVSRKGGPGESRKGDILGVCSHMQGAVQMPVA